MRNLRRGLLMVILVLSLVITGIPAAADTIGSAGMDVVIVIDTSGSMKYTDEHRIALDAAKLFVDMMDCSGSRVGLVSFSDQLGAVVNLTGIYSQADKDSVKNSINSLVYTEDTDIGLAMQKAMELLNSGGDVGNKKAILFFTDGAIDLPDAADPAQAAADSRAKAESAAQSAAAAGIPVYTIGLDASAQDSQYRLDEELIRQMADSTNGIYNKVTNAEELPNIFNQIFANFVESEIVPGGTITIQDSNTYESLGFTVPNDSVMEANVILLSSSRLSDILLLDPNGNTLAIDGQKVALSIQDRYSMLKLFYPQSGNWTLQVKGDAGCTVQCQWLFNYDVVLKASAAATDSGAGVTAYLENKGQPLTDDTIYAEFNKVVARVTNPDGTVTEYPMTYASGQFTGEVAVNPGESATLVVRAESPTMYRESDPITVAGPELPTETEPVITAGMSDPIILKGFLPNLAKETIDLSGCITTTSGNALTYSAQIADPAVAGAEINGSKLVLKGVKKGTTTVTVAAADPAGVTNSQTVNVEVRPVLNSLLPLNLAAAALILLIVLLVVIMTLKPKKPVGNLYWHLEYEDSYGDVQDEEHVLGLNGSKELLSAIAVDPAVAFVDLNKIEITGVKKGTGIIVKSAAKNCELNDSMGGTAKKITVREDDEFSVLCNTEDGEVILRCYYTMQEREDY